MSIDLVKKHRNEPVIFLDKILNFLVIKLIKITVSEINLKQSNKVLGMISKTFLSLSQLV